MTSPEEIKFGLKYFKRQFYIYGYIILLKIRKREVDENALVYFLKMSLKVFQKGL